jgi:hypothetical protein
MNLSCSLELSVDRLLETHSYVNRSVHMSDTGIYTEIEVRSHNLVTGQLQPKAYQNLTSTAQKNYIYLY